MLSPLPRRSDWAYCFAHFTQPYQPSPIWQSSRPAHCPFRGLLGVHSRYGLRTRAVTVFRDTLSGGFSHFVASIAAPVASGWSGCRVGFAPTGKRRLFTAHANNRHATRNCLLRRSAAWLEHRHEGAIALMNRVVADEGMEPLPIREVSGKQRSPRLFSGPIRTCLVLDYCVLLSPK